MNKTCVIQWKSTVNGRTGRGTKLFDREEAERLVAELNQEYPHILHECVDVESELVQPPEQHPDFNSIPLLSVA